MQFQDNLSMVNWRWGWVVNWLGGWMVHWLRGWVVGLGFWVGGNTLVLDIGNVAIWTIGVRSVGDNLGATIRKGNSVRAAHGLAIRVLSLGKVGTRVLIVHSILISVGLWGLIIDRGGMVWGWWADWGGRGNSG